jgi:hypothetical protein
VKATLLVLSIQFLAQSSGANAISAYAIAMSDSIGFGSNPYLPAIAITSVRIGGSLLSFIVLRNVMGLIIFVIL